MEDSKKKPIMIGVIVVCLIVAGLITYAKRSRSDIDVIPDDKMTWVKCNNPSCKAEYEMSEKQYFKDVIDVKVRINSGARNMPPLTCEKCGKDSLFQAVKCANPSCGAVFFRGSVPGELPDRCPECGQSEMEEIRNKRRAGR